MNNHAYLRDKSSAKQSLSVALPALSALLDLLPCSKMERRLLVVNPR